MESNTFETTNINALWLQNIYDNLKNLEMLERLAREGCSQIYDYFQMSEYERIKTISDVQYKNLSFLITEMHLLLSDLTPVIEENKLNDFRNSLESIEQIIGKRTLFVKDIYSASHSSVTHSSVTPFYWQTLRFISRLKIQLVKEIAPILYIKASEPDQYG